MTPFYVGRILTGAELDGAQPGTIVQVLGYPEWDERVKLQSGDWYYFDDKAEGPLSRDVDYIIVAFAEMKTPDPVGELAEELFRATHSYVSREVPFSDLSGSDEYREIARLVLTHFDHKIRGPVDVA